MKPINTIDRMLAIGGREHRNETAGTHTILLDNLPQGIEGAWFSPQHDMTSVIRLQLPTGGVWDRISPNNAVVEIKGDAVVWVYRETNIFNYKILAMDGGAVSLLDPAALTPALPDNDLLLIGQSMMTGLSQHPQSFLELNARTRILNAAVGGSSLYEYEDGSYWWDDALDQPGPLTLAAETLAAGRNVTRIALAQIHDNADEAQLGTLTKSDFVAGWIKVLTYLGWPAIPAIVEKPGRNALNNEVGYQLLCDAWEELLAANPSIRSYSVHDRLVTHQDGAHRDSAGYAETGRRLGLLAANPSLVPPRVAAHSYVSAFETLLTFSEPVSHCDFAGIHGIELQRAEWAADGMSVKLHHNAADSPELRWPWGSGLRLGGSPYGSGNLSMHFPLERFTLLPEDAV